MAAVMAKFDFEKFCAHVQKFVTPLYTRDHTTAAAIHVDGQTSMGSTFRLLGSNLTWTWEGNGNRI